MDNRHWSEFPLPPADAGGHQVAGQPPASWAFNPPNGHHNGGAPEPVGAGDDPHVPAAWPAGGAWPEDAGQPDRGAWPEGGTQPDGHGHPDRPAGPGRPEPDRWAGYHVELAGARDPWDSSRYDIAGRPAADPHRQDAPAGPRHSWAAPARTPSSAAPEPDEPGYDPPPGWLPVLAGTAGAFVVPVFIYILWSLSLSSEPPAGCVDAVGAACRSPREDALANLRGILPALTAALALALVTAAGLRWISRWRSPTIAFAAAVIGAGVVTLIGSALS